MFKKLFTTCLCLSMFVLFAPVVAAQYFADISMQTFPKYPKVGDTVNVTLDSSDVNLDFQDISWYVNGAPALSGPAQTGLVFVVEPNVKTYTIRAVIGNSTSQVVKETIINPGQVILLWEAVDSYIPHWYRGKALMPAEGLVRITAIPVGSSSLDKLFFVWKQGTNTLADQSGYAKNSIVIRNNILLDTLDITVTVGSAGGDFQSEASLSIPRTEPDVRIWEPRIGYAPSYERAGVLFVHGADTVIEALPYGMVTRTGLSGIAYDWLINKIAYIPREQEPENSIFIARTQAPLAIEIAIQGLERVLQDIVIQKRVIFE